MDQNVISIDDLRAKLPGDLSVVRGWRDEARTRYLETLWQAVDVPRATRRSLLREIKGLSYAEICGKYGKWLKPEEPAAERAPAVDESEYWASLEHLANFLKGITR